MFVISKWACYGLFVLNIFKDMDTDTGMANDVDVDVNNTDMTMYTDMDKDVDFTTWTDNMQKNNRVGGGNVKFKFEISVLPLGWQKKKK